MSQDFEKKLILDDRLMCTDKLSYGVFKGGQNMTCQPYAAISQSSSSITWNLQIPSEQTLIDRRWMWTANVTLKFVFSGSSLPPAGQYPISYGTTDALAPFPLHQLCTVQSITINNNTVSLNTRDNLPALMRMNDKRELMRYNSLCPTAFDTYGRYSDAVGAINNPLGGYTNVGDNDLLPRGAFAVKEIYQLAGDLHVPQALSNGTTAQTVYVNFVSTEPLLISPLIWAHPESNNQAFYGIVNANCVFNLGSANRVFRSASPWMASAAVTIDSIDSSVLLLNQLTAHPSQLLPSRNIVPYYTQPRFISTFTKTTVNVPAVVNGVFDPNLRGNSLSSTNLQLNMIPDKVIIFVRKALADQTPNDPDVFLAIRGISINFNNQSGILSSASVQDLYKFSSQSTNQSFQEFIGVACVGSADNSQPAYIPTCGSVLVLNFGEHIQIQDDYYSPGSLGNFQFQFNLNVVDQFNGTLAGNNGWEMVLITVNSGLFAVERGTASSYQGILTRSDVLDVSTQQPYSHSDIKRMVGGGMEDTLKSVMGKMSPHLKASGKPDVLGSLGYGRSGGGMSGGGMSGGSKHKLSSKLY